MTATCEHTCPTKSTLCTKYTIRDLLKKLQEEIRDATRSEEAVTALTEGITFIETEYSGIADLVTAYDTLFPEIQKPGARYCTAERQWKDLQTWVTDEKVIKSLDPEIKNAIEALRQKNYRDETEGCLPKTHPKAVLDEAIEAFRRLKSCCQQSKEAEEDASALYTEAKTFQATAESWFTDLEALHAAAKNDFERKKYRALYAYYLEACQVWAKIEDLSSVPQDPEWLRQKLVAELKNVLITKDEHFLWHDCWLKIARSHHSPSEL